MQKITNVQFQTFQYFVKILIIKYRILFFLPKKNQTRFLHTQKTQQVCSSTMFSVHSHCIVDACGALGTGNQILHCQEFLTLLFNIETWCHSWYKGWIYLFIFWGCSLIVENSQPCLDPQRFHTLYSLFVFSRHLMFCDSVYRSSLCVRYWSLSYIICNGQFFQRCFSWSMVTQ